MDLKLLVLKPLSPGYLPLFTVSLMMPRRKSNEAKSFPSLPSHPAAPCQSGYFGNLCFKEANGWYSCPKPTLETDQLPVDALKDMLRLITQNLVS